MTFTTKDTMDTKAKLFFVSFVSNVVSVRWSSADDLR